MKEPKNAKAAREELAKLTAEEALTAKYAPTHYGRLCRERNARMKELVEYLGECSA